VGNTALVHEVDYQLDLVQALEIRHFRCVAGFNQYVVARFDQLGHATAQHHLLAEEIRLALLPKGGLDDAGATAAYGAAIGEGCFERGAGSVLRHSDKAGRSTTAKEFVPYGMAWRLWRDHKDVEIVAWIKEIEVNVEPVREGEGCTRSHVGVQI